MSVVSYKKHLSTTKNAPHKRLVKGKKNTAGRNNQGRITAHYRGSGNKRKYRDIDFVYNKKDINANKTTFEPISTEDDYLCVIEDNRYNRYRP
mgnify:CR=1 FL=1